MRHAITADEARRLFNYSPVTGELFYKSSCRRVGARAGRPNAGGYLRVTVGGRGGTDYMVHRLIWLIVTGEWPAAEIDHIDGRPDNNAWHNLRDASRALNSQNMRRAKSTNTQGLLGVSKKNFGKWAANITVDSKQRYLGRFDTPQEAHAVYLEAKRRLHAGCTI